jgi:uncharacterized membrane protein YphA (DoxX/SURF4 family)
LLAASLVPDIARVVLGAVFVVSGLAKIASGARWTAQASGLGVPRAIAAALPWVELALGAAVASGLADPWPAVAAIAVLAVFTAWIVVHLARGQHPPCACFGSLSLAPLSWRHVVRNGVLLALGTLSLLSL